MATEDQQKKLKALIERRHPQFEHLTPHWEFCEETYEGGRAWFSKNIFQYIKEGEEFKKRVDRAYRFNHSKEVVDLVDRYIFKMPIVRSEDAPEYLKEFWKRSTLQGLDISGLMKTASRYSSIYGRDYLVIDSNFTGENVSIAEKKASGFQVYGYVVPPTRVLDMSFAEDGSLNWILIAEEAREDEDPIESSGSVFQRFRLWTRDSWSLLTPVRAKNGKLHVEMDGPHEHGLGEVPVIPVNHTFTDELYNAPGLIDDVAYLDRAVANYLSNLDQIIQDQTFSQLAMPAQNVLPGEDSYAKLVEMGTKRVFLYDGESSTAPFYLSPDVKQAQLILSVVNKIINEIYHTVGLAGERTKDDNGGGIDNSSGVAKAYDFERVNALLAHKSSSLQWVENRVCELVAKWNGETLVQKDHSAVTYPQTFDVRGLYDEFEIAARLSLLDAPDELRRTQMEHVVEKLFPSLKEEVKKRIEASLKQWPPKLELGTGENQDRSGEYGDQIKSQASNALANKLVS